MNIETIWNNIKSNEGEAFRTIRGVEYTYVVVEDYILINNDKKRRITKDSIKTAITINNPSSSKIQKQGIGGPSYVWGIITDKRI
ncbi:MAG: hypothetical protein SO533_00970 [Eubacteriales bacterium]|nr:hypothetical protein [Eubacteriales bacterium]